MISKSLHISFFGESVMTNEQFADALKQKDRDDD